ncbi:MAG: hypothetical protein M5U34_04815 [Chloroflexi bacterium]|nr:hypothetical protein [Chloroflexota bacterium]
MTLTAEPGSHLPPPLEKALCPDEGVVNWLLLANTKSPRAEKAANLYRHSPG